MLGSIEPLIARILSQSSDWQVPFPRRKSFVLILALLTVCQVMTKATTRYLCPIRQLNTFPGGGLNVYF